MNRIRLLATTSIEEGYAKRLDDIEERYRSVLLNGTAEDYANYQHLVGVLKGLDLARSAFNDFTDAARKLDEES